MMVSGWTRSIARAALIVCVSLLASSGSGSAQTAPAVPTDTPTPAAAAPTDTPTPVPPAAPIDSAAPVPVAAAPVASPTPIFSSGVPCATDDPTTERVRRSERHGDDLDGEGDHDEFRTGNGRNEVILHNCTDNRLRVRAAIQLNTIPGRVVIPLNEAYAEGSCLRCQTLSVALQIDAYSAERARDIEPQNFAVAINTGCTRCVTVALAIQYVQGVDDPQDVSEELGGTVDALSRELTAIQSDRSVTLPEAESRLNAVIARFNTLGGSLSQQRQERDD